MRMMTFAKRCAKELLRDPINVAFGFGFPVVLLYLLSAIQANIPASLYEIDTLTPGITVQHHLRELILSWDICSRFCQWHLCRSQYAIWQQSH